MLVKTVEKTITVKKIKEVTNSLGSRYGYALVSISPWNDWGIHLTVGACFEDRSSCFFNKKALENLIEDLTEVAEAMKDDDCDGD